jgi:hypothetical protein
LYYPLFVNKHNLYEVIKNCFIEKSNITIDPQKWENSIYKPTPTIIEAAQALYK